VTLRKRIKDLCGPLSKLTQQPFALGSRYSKSVELDHFLRRPVALETEYITALDVEAAIKSITEACRIAPLVIVEGPIVWPVVEPILRAGHSREICRVYLKRMSSTHPDVWHDGDFLYEYEPPGAYFRSITRYHRQERPWLLADAVFERIGTDDE
jgi:hypothetical protein